MPWPWHFRAFIFLRVASSNRWRCRRNFPIIRAFVWEKAAGFRDLNDLIAADPDWVLQAATSINERGEIVGYGEYKGDDDSGFLLLPQR